MGSSETLEAPIGGTIDDEGGAPPGMDVRGDKGGGPVHGELVTGRQPHIDGLHRRDNARIIHLAYGRTRPQR